MRWIERAWVEGLEAARGAQVFIMGEHWRRDGLAQGAGWVAAVRIGWRGCSFQKTPRPQSYGWVSSGGGLVAGAVESGRERTRADGGGCVRRCVRATAWCCAQAERHCEIETLAELLSAPTAADTERESPHCRLCQLPSNPRTARQSHPSCPRQSRGTAHCTVTL
jgi:hypothetical protein